jgi:Mg/Co/Ni transporter MgtE
MDPDDAADLLAELSEMDKNRLLELMEPEESAPVRRLLEYATHSAGGLMTPEPVVLAPDSSIAEALARVRNPDLTPALASMVFVCRPPTDTPTGQYLGCAHIQRLLREPPFNLVAGAVDMELTSLRPTDSLTEVTRYFAAYNLVCAPVVDEQNHLLGAITVDDILDHLLPEGWRESSTGDRDASGGNGIGASDSGRDSGKDGGSEAGSEAGTDNDGDTGRRGAGRETEDA